MPKLKPAQTGRVARFVLFVLYGRQVEHIRLWYGSGADCKAAGAIVGFGGRV